MASEADYEKMIAKYNRRSLPKLWQQILARNTPGWEPGKAFEYLILRAFQLEGAEIQWPFRVYDRQVKALELEQIDGAIFLDGGSYLVSSKDETNPIDVHPISRLRDQLLKRPPCVIGLFFSCSGFTPPALRSASAATAPTILLWQGEEIDLALRERNLAAALKTKYRRAVTHGIADFNIPTPP